MSNRNSTNQQIKALILRKLRTRGCWGAKYTHLDTTVRWLSKRVKRNGRRVKRAMRELVQNGYLLLHKRGATVSLNPTRSMEVVEIIERNI